MAEPVIYGRLLTAGFRRSLVTPEGVDLSLTLADFGQRFTAFLLDLLIMLGLLIAVTEKRTRQEIDSFATALGKVLQ